MAEKAYCGICNENFKSEEALAMHSAAKHPGQQMRAKQSHKSRMIFIILGVVILVIVAGYFARGLLTGKAISENINQIQKITIGFKDYTYYPRTITVKQGIPVEITLDSSVRGCFRSFNIRDLGVSQSSFSPADTIKFTPSQKGQFKFACGMGMASGIIIVE